MWIPITVGAAVTQTIRNAAQRHLTRDLGTLGATLVRFWYGLPFAIIWLAILAAGFGMKLPNPNWAFAAWTFVGAAGQLVATALMLRVMEERNFAVGAVYSKTEILQIAVFSIVLLGDPLTPAAAAAILVATAGLVLLSPRIGPGGVASILRAWSAPAALYGLGSGACFAISAVGYRGAALALRAETLFVAAAYVLVWALAMQVAALGGWLLLRSPGVVIALLRAWRLSLAAGFAGGVGSAGWLTAMALEPVAHVRTLGLIELLFSMAVSRQVFRERMGAIEIAGILCVGLGVATMASLR